MNILKTNKLLVAALLLEGCFVICYSVTSSRGLIATHRLQKTAEEITGRIQELQQEIDLVADELEAWRKYPWYREQYARTVLQMARPGDEIYLI